jgi:hypothetical protein
MPEQIFVSFPEETAQLLSRKMKEEGVTDQAAFAAELLIRNLSRRKTSEAWEEIIRQIITDSIGDDDGESTILILPSDEEDE